MAKKSVTKKVVADAVSSQSELAQAMAAMTGASVAETSPVVDLTAPVVGDEVAAVVIPETSVPDADSPVADADAAPAVPVMSGFETVRKVCFKNPGKIWTFVGGLQVELVRKTVQDHLWHVVGDEPSPWLVVPVPGGLMLSAVSAD